ncbi:MAG: adenylosuccinate lyase [Mycoplasmatales bacterium]
MIERYQSNEMKELWSDLNKFNSWLEVEILSTEAFASLGDIPSEDAKLIRQNASFDLERIYTLEKELRHDVVSFTRAVSESLGDEKKWIHYGLTSTDVVDTAYGYLIKQANQLIDIKLDKFIEVIKNRAIEHKYTIQMGRTHGVHAELTTFGYKLALYYEEMLRNKERFELAKKQIEVGKISGAVGTYANINPKIQDYVCKELGIDSSNISTQTLQRDRHAFYIMSIASISNTIDKMATEFRHLQRTELREVEEGFGKKQKGSSAMPHKKNPISSENMSGLARVIRGYTLTAMEDVALWHERDISHSSAERIIIPDATSLIEYMLNRMTNVLDNLYVNEDKMLKNIDATKNVFFSQKVMLTLIDKGMSREEAYDLVQPIAINSFNNDLDFKEEIQDKVKDTLSCEEFNNCFKKDYHLENIDLVFKRIGLEE